MIANVTREVNAFTRHLSDGVRETSVTCAHRPGRPISRQPRSRHFVSRIDQSDISFIHPYCYLLPSMDH